MTEHVHEQGQPTRVAAGPLRRWRGVVVAGVIAIGGTISLVALQRPAQSDSRFALVEHAVAPAAVPPDPLMTELIRCRALPPQIDDPACRAAWDENRRHFFGASRTAPGPGDPRPASASIPAPGSASAATER